MGEVLARELKDLVSGGIAGRRTLENPMSFEPTFMKEWRLV